MLVFLVILNVFVTMALIVCLFVLRGRIEQLEQRNPAPVRCPHGYTDWDQCPVCNH